MAAHHPFSAGSSLCVPFDDATARDYTFAFPALVGAIMATAISALVW